MIIKINHQPINIDVEIGDIPHLVPQVASAAFHTVSEMAHKMQEPFFFHFQHHGEHFLSIDVNPFNIPHHLIDATSNIFVGFNFFN